MTNRTTRGASLNIIRSKEFEGTRAWDALHIATLSGVSVRLHWTDKPYIWHVNDGQEVFAVMDGIVDPEGHVNSPTNGHRKLPHLS